MPGRFLEIPVFLGDYFLYAAPCIVRRICGKSVFWVKSENSRSIGVMDEIWRNLAGSVT